MEELKMEPPPDLSSVYSLQNNSAVNPDPEPPPLTQHSTSSKEPDQDNLLEIAKAPSIMKREPVTANEGPVICDECGKSFPTAHHLNGHKINQHNPNRREYQCPECLQNFKQGPSLWTHYYRFHMEKTLLPADLELLLVRGSSKSEGPTSSTICGICGKVYKDPSSLTRHMVKEHEAPDLRYPCPECGKDFKDKDWMQAHRKKEHLGKMVTRCDKCGKNEASEGKLWRHRVEVHGMGGEEAGRGLESVRWEECRECGELLLSGKPLIGHLKERHGGGEVLERWREEKQRKKERNRKVKGNGKTVRKRAGEWGCGKEGCGSVFTRKEHLRRHLMEVHCELEEKIVGMKIIRVEESLREGEGDRYGCTLCGGRFGHRAEVKIHVVRDHPEVYRGIMEGTEVKIRMRCPMEDCGEEMEGGEEEVRTHLEERHGEECWRCPECERVMLSPEEMEVHWRREHGDGEEEGVEEKGEGGRWMWRRTTSGWRRSKGVVGEEKTGELRRKRKAVYSKYRAMRGSCEICGVGLSFDWYKIHLRRCHGVEEEEWGCDICGRGAKGNNGLKRRECWLAHMELIHGGEVDMEVMVEKARKMNVEGGLEGLGEIHKRMWSNGRLRKEDSEAFGEGVEEDKKWVEVEKRRRRRGKMEGGEEKKRRLDGGVRSKEVSNGYSLSKMSCEICGIGLSLGSYLGHLRKQHGVEERDEWRCHICGGGRDKKGLKRRECWLAHMEVVHGNEVDMKELLEKARKMNVEGGLEGLGEIHWKKWVSGQLVEGQEEGQGKKMKEKKKKGNIKRKRERPIRKVDVKPLKRLSAKLEEMRREVEKEKRLVIGPLRRVKAVRREILYLDVNS